MAIRSRTKLALPSLLLLLVLPARGGDSPLAELDRAVRELETTVRTLHAERLALANDVAHAREDAARIEAEASDLEQQKQGLDDENAASTDSLRSLEAQRDAARAKLTRLTAMSDAVAAVVSTSGEPLPGATLPDRLAMLLRRLEARAENARSAEIEPDGTVRLGSLARFAPGSEEARRLSVQQTGEGEPGPLPLSLVVGEPRKP